jgi:hypothetical protein
LSRALAVAIDLFAPGRLVTTTTHRINEYVSVAEAARCIPTVTETMPPKGLYLMPQHHLIGQGTPMKRPSYNSMDFAENNEPVSMESNDGATDEVVDEEKAKRKQEKAERKEARRLKRLSKEAEATKEPAKVGEKQKTPPVDTTPTATLKPEPLKNGKYGPRGPYKKKEIGPDGKPMSAAKKRKLEADDAVAQSAAISIEPPKKPGNPKSLGKKDVVESIETAKKVVKSGETKAKKQKLDKALPTTTNLKTSSDMIKTPVPVPSAASASSSRPRQTPVPLPQKTPVPLPHKTPVPLPQKSPRALEDSVSQSPAKETKATPAQSEMLVAETPPSQMSRTPATTTRMAAIPFSLASASSSAVTTTTKAKKTPASDESSPEITLMDIAKLEKAGKAVVGSQGSVNPLTNSQIESFTSSNLMQFKQPLNDAPKPRPRGRRTVSEATSTTSSDSSSSDRSILDMFPRPNKPYTRPGEDLSSFNKKANEHAEKHDEANCTVFTAAYAASQRTVNFTDEAEYVEEYDEWLSVSQTARPLPCLAEVTGCSPKSEQLLQLQRSDDTDTPALKVIVTNASEVEKATADIKRVETASAFLRHSILARVPVPLGSIEGTWKLYCPKYTDTHVDKYGFGQRTLRIFSTYDLGGTSGAYTASLYIPPRSPSYTTRAFQVPPHASFRPMLIKTVVGNHKMDVIFLGNGYLKLRVDMHLMATGKTAAEVKAAQTGRPVKLWEFFGVLSKAVVWEPEVDELEKEGRRLTARYSGR